MQSDIIWRAGFEIEVVLSDLDDGRFFYALEDPMDTASTAYCQAVAKRLTVATGRTWTAPGASVGTNRYDPWGIPATANIGRFQYTGQAWLAELGMYHYKARIYSPYLGRFLQTDPVGYEDQVNLYAYVGNDPLNKTDPSGAFRCYTTSYGQHCVSDGTLGDNIAVLLYKFLVEAGIISMNESSENPDRTSDDPLRASEHGRPVPDSEAAGSPHTQLGTRTGRKGKYPQSREFDEEDNPVRDVDHTDHGRPGQHSNPYQHPWLPNPTGGSPSRGTEQAMPNPPELPKIAQPPLPPTVRKLPF